MKIYYNEIDPYACDWLSNLMDVNAIAPGFIDNRSIEDVVPSELERYTQCHFFAGIGVWSYALRRAGWSDDRPVWTGSCPCQPFSAAGKGDGFADERHLWPAWYHLIRQCQPAAILGEQVEAAIKHAWLDLVLTDLEGCGYATGAVGIPACGVGAPHIRQRLYWVADAAGIRRDRGRCPSGTPLQGDSPKRNWSHSQSGITGELSGGSEGLGRASNVRVGDSLCPGLEGYAGDGDNWHGSGRVSAAEAGPVTAPGCTGCEFCGYAFDRDHLGRYGCPNCEGGSGECRPPTNGFWSDVDWLPFRDGKIRPIEPGTSPLVAGTATRVGRDGTPERLNIPAMLKGYGNALCAEDAVEFIKAFMGARKCSPEK